MAKTAIVILNWNGKHYLDKFLPSVISYSSFSDSEIWVADNGSTDDSIEFLKKHFPQVQFVLLDRNYGFAEGYNKALEKISATYYVLLNSDVEVTPHWIDPVVEILDKNPDVAACMPKLRAFHDRTSFEYAGAAGGFIDKYGYPFCRGRVFNTLERDNAQFDDEAEVFWATGACLFIRSELFHRFGGFDPAFFAHMEEIDLCWRLKNSGYRIMYTSRSVVYHVGGGTLNKENPHKTYLNYRNNLFMLCKNLPRRKFLRTILIRMVLDGISACKHAVMFQFPYFLAILRAHLHYYRRLPELTAFRRKNREHLNYTKHKEMSSKSIIYQSFFLKKKTFSEIEA